MKLFWRILLGHWLAWALLSAGVYGGITLAQQAALFDHGLLSLNRPTTFVVANAAVGLELGGEPFFHRYAAAWPQGRNEPPYVVDSGGRELLGRPVGEAVLAQARGLADRGDQPSPVKLVRGPEGGDFLVFYPAGLGPGERSFWRFLFEWPWLFGVALAGASLLFAGMLAISLTRPIGVLKEAFDAMADGELAARAGERLGRRRDELGELGRHFDAMAGRLEQLVGAQKRLLHDVSHELRSPLARLGVATALARQRPDRLPEALDRIDRESARLDGLIGEVLTLARLEEGASGRVAPGGGGGAVPFDDYVDLVELLAVIAEDAAFEAEAVGQEIRTDLPEIGEIVVQGNAELLHRALENVVRNALQHAKGSRRIDVSVERRSAQVVVRVRDHGEGLSEAELANLWQPFGRGRASAGFGLGLSIAHRTALAHGGGIAARNHPGGGLEVEITLPTAE